MSRVSMAGFTIHSVGCVVDRSDVGAGGTQVKVMLRVEHDATGRRCGPLHVTACSKAVLGPALGAEALRELAKEALLSAFAHEIDEWLRVDGRLVPPEHLDPKRE